VILPRTPLVALATDHDGLQARLNRIDQYLHDFGWPIRETRLRILPKGTR
jgi:hypothetical protein